MRRADRVCHLKLAPVGQAGRDDVLRDVARHVRGRSVDLRRVLAAERAAAVRRYAAVRVDDDLAAGEPGVGLRAADLEPSGRVHHRLRRRRVEVGELAQHGVDDLRLDVGLQERLDVDLLAVLRARSGPCRRAPACRPRTRWRPGSCRRDADTERRPLCGRRRGAWRAGGPWRSGSGISSSVSRQAKPNIMPWSPAPSGRARRRNAPRGARARRRRRARCRATAPGSR